MYMYLEYFHTLYDVSTAVWELLAQNERFDKGAGLLRD